MRLHEKIISAHLFVLELRNYDIFQLMDSCI